jgi:hypothetical protein
MRADEIGLRAAGRGRIGNEGHTTHRIAGEFHDMAGRIGDRADPVTSPPDTFWKAREK